MLHRLERTAGALLLFLLLAPAASSTTTASVPEKPDRQIALTFDDLPAQRSRGLPEARIERLNRRILAALTDADAPAIGFVNEGKLERDGEVLPQRVELLESWLDAGHELGNHGYAHRDLHRVPREEFEQDILEGERRLRPLLAGRDLEPRYFRHPFLHTGVDLETRGAIHAFLAKHGYRVAPVTVDNSEWIFARAYDEALDREDPELAERLGAEYVDYMEAMVAYYEDQSRQLFDREIPQVLLVHANALNGDHLPPLLERLRTRGYRFVTLDEALVDPAYDSEDTYTGRGGITWLHRWALARKVDPAMFRGEPSTPGWVQEVAGIEE